jgi:hypothetical protein
MMLCIKSFLISFSKWGFNIKWGVENLCHYSKLWNAEVKPMFVPVLGGFWMPIHCWLGFQPNSQNENKLAPLHVKTLVRIDSKFSHEWKLIMRTGSNFLNIFLVLGDFRMPIHFQPGFQPNSQNGNNLATLHVRTTTRTDFKFSHEWKLIMRTGSNFLKIFFRKLNRFFHYGYIQFLKTLCQLLFFSHGVDTLLVWWNN